MSARVIGMVCRQRFLGIGRSGLLTNRAVTASLSERLVMSVTSRMPAISRHAALDSGAFQSASVFDGGPVTLPTDVVTSPKFRRQAWAVGFGLLCLVIAGRVAMAQQAAPVTADTGSIDAKMSQAKAFIDKMSVMVSDGFAELEEARKSQNINRVNCVNDALTTMNGLKRLADSNFTALQECASRKDSDGADHEYIKVSIAFNKSEELSGQLKGCGGPSVDGTIDGRPYIEKDFATDLPQINPVAGLNDLTTPLEVPPSASPFFKQ